MIKDTNDTYGKISIINHWVTSVSMISMILFGFYLKYGWIPPTMKGDFYGYHKAFGTIVLIFGMWRVLWRVIQGFPKPASKMRYFQEAISRIIHYILLTSVIAMPLSGIIMSIYSGRSVKVFGIFTIPPMEKSTKISYIAHEFHEISGIVISAIIVIHALAALKHHFIDKDKTLKRMISFPK